MTELIKIQEELKAPKNQRNSFGNYNYRSCEDILEALKPLLSKYECYITITDNIELIGDRYYVRAMASLMNKDGKSVSVSSYAREQLEKKGMDSSQITGATSSYARKYALNGLFAIDDARDADTQDNRNEGKKEIKVELISDEDCLLLQNEINELGLDLGQYLAFFKISKLADLPKNKLSVIWKSIEKKKGGIR